ncbi:MAG: hypothetical protein R6X11_00255 [Desulfonatronovibrio sp.]
MISGYIWQIVSIQGAIGGDCRHQAWGLSAYSIPMNGWGFYGKVKARKKRQLFEYLDILVAPTLPIPDIA